jgi:hypothetical protein
MRRGPLPSIRLLRHAVRARRRLYRRTLRTVRRRAHARISFLLLWSRNQAILRGRYVLKHGRRYIATTAGSVVALLFVLTLPGTPATMDALKASDVHLASAGIIGTALALVLSLSIVPAQKAADVFSSAILQLYARDRTTLGVFTLLSCAALLSLLFGTGWAFSLSARYTLAGQFILLGASLDALRAFYSRALSLLDPATALGLVSDECRGYIKRISDEVERLLRLQNFDAGDEGNNAAFRYLCYSKSRLPRALNSWTTQLEEFAHKGIARRDTLAVNTIVGTMAGIGKNYAEARRSSMLLVPDLYQGP